MTVAARLSVRVSRSGGLPVESVPREHFGWLGAFYGAEVAATSTLTQQRFGWEPVGPGLLQGLEHGSYFTPAAR
jgi:hypothetical protein